MMNFIFSFFLTLSVLISPLKAENTAFIDALGDIPLFENMVVDQDSLIIFDKAEGHFIEIATYAPLLSAQEPLYYYAKTLPQMGWVSFSASSMSSTYKRGTDQLKIEKIKSTENIILRFSLATTKRVK